MSAGSGPLSNEYGKRPGSVSGSTGAHACASLAEVETRIGLHKDPVREGIQAPRVIARRSVRVADSENW